MVHDVRDHALLPGPASFWTPPSAVTAEDVVPGLILLVFWSSGLLPRYSALARCWSQLGCWRGEEERERGFSM